MKHLGRAVSGGRRGKCRGAGTQGMENAGRAGIMQGTETRTRSSNEMQQRKEELVSGCKRLG